MITLSDSVGQEGIREGRLPRCRLYEPLNVDRRKCPQDNSSVHPSWCDYFMECILYLKSLKKGRSKS